MKFTWFTARMRIAWVRARYSLCLDSDGVVVHRLKSPLGLLSPLITQQTGLPGLKAHKLHDILKHDFDVIRPEVDLYMTPVKPCDLP
jgi:hypothetical protein